MHRWKASTQSIASLAFSPDSTRLVSLGRLEAACVWNLGKGIEKVEVNLPAGCRRALAVAPDGRSIAVAWQGPGGHVCDFTTGAAGPPLEDANLLINDLQFSPDGQLLLAAGIQCGRLITDPGVIACLWHVATGRLVYQFRELMTRKGIACAADGRSIVWGLISETGPEYRTVLVDVPTGKHRLFMVLPLEPRQWAFSPDGQWLAAATVVAAHLWSLPPLAEPERRFVPAPPAWTIESSEDNLTAITFGPDGGWLLAGTVQCRACRWDLTDPPRQTAAWDWDIGPITAVAVAPDGLTAAAGSASGETVVWDLDR
jgi:WD40 repeat protein